MIVCRKCRANNLDTDAFCGSCGAFLEWTGEKVAPEEPELIEVEDEPEPEDEARPGLIRRVTRAVENAISPAQAREDTGTQWTGFGKEPAAAPGSAGKPTGGAPAAQGGAASAAPAPPGPPGPKPAAPAGPPAPPGPPAAKAPAPPAPPAPPGAKPPTPPALPVRPAGPGSASPPTPPAPPAPPGSASPPTPPAPPAPPGYAFPPTPASPPKPPPAPGAGPGAAGPPTPPLAAAPPAAPKAPSPPSAPAPGTPQPPAGDTGQDELVPAEVVPTRKLAGQKTAALVAAVEGTATRASDPSNGGGSANATTAVVDAPEEVLPQRTAPRVAPVTKTKPTRRLRPGDLICGQCGEGNPPTRKFCSRCGEELTTATVVKTPWWKRLLRRKPKVMDAGTRPGLKGARSRPKPSIMGVYRKVMGVVGTCVVGLIMLSLFMPSQIGEPLDRMLGNPVDRVKGWWADQRDPYESVFPVDWEANRAPQPGHGAQQAFDDNTLTYWSTVWKPNRRRLATYLTVTFSEPVEDLAVFVYAGAPGEDFTKFHSPSVLRFDYGDGRDNDTVELARQQEASKLFELKNADGATEITIWVEDVHDQRGGTHVAISELEFKQK